MKYNLLGLASFGRFEGSKFDLREQIFVPKIQCLKSYRFGIFGFVRSQAFIMHQFFIVKSTTFWILGGNDGSSLDSTEIIIQGQTNGFARTQGPSLILARYYHYCSTMKDGEKTVIVAAGGYEGLDSVEIYDPTDNTWHSGINKC